MTEITRTALQLHLDGRNTEALFFVERKLQEPLSQEDRGNLEVLRQGLIANAPQKLSQAV